jgi:hypothetical protein
MPNSIKYSTAMRAAFNTKLKEISQDAKIEIWRSHTNLNEYSSLLVCYTVLTGINVSKE